MLRVGWALCVALAVGGCRAGTLEVGSPGGRVSAGDGAAAVAGGGDGGGGGTGASVDAASSNELDGGVADAGTPSATGACVPLDPTALRLLSPQSGSIVTSAAPRFRWTGGRHPYRLQVCADRACDDVVVEVGSAETEATLPQDLPPGYWFWRVQSPDVADGFPPSWTSPWEMRVRRRFSGYGPTANTSVGGFSDYNGDGYPDLAFYGAGPLVYLGGPDGLSASRVWQSGPSTSRTPSLVEPQVDVNGDGFTDVSSWQSVSLAGHAGPNYAAQIQFGAANGFAPADALVDVAFDAYAILEIDNPVGLGDFDGDGFGDLVMQFRYGGDLIRGCAPAPANAPWAGLGAGNGQLQQVATGDFDGDGRTDLIYADGSAINLYRGNPEAATPVAISGMSGLWVVDFNYDGYSDLVIKDEWPADTLRAYEGGPNGLSSTLSTETQPTAFVLVGDFDGDGYWDTIGPDCTNGCPTVASVSYGGSSGWGPPYARTTPLDRSIADSGAIVVDLNADGYDDLLIPGSDDTAMSWYAGSPSGLATAPTVILSP